MTTKLINTPDKSMANLVEERLTSICYAPAELRFYALHKGERVENGDYWLPDEKAGYHNSYPVKISSAGIHYTYRLSTDDDYIEHSDGRTYYGSWESESVHAKGVSLLLHNTKNT
jgi:hypothetical protein